MSPLARPRRFRRAWIDYSVDVDASESELYALLSDLERWPAWTPGLVALRRRGRAELGIGSMFTMTVKLPPLPTLPLPCTLLTREPHRIEWGGGALGAVIRHRFELSPLGPRRTRLRHVEYATGWLALLLIPFETLILRHDKGWSDAIAARFAPIAQTSLSASAP